MKTDFHPLKISFSSLLLMMFSLELLFPENYKVLFYNSRFSLWCPKKDCFGGDYVLLRSLGAMFFLIPFAGQRGDSGIQPWLNCYRKLLPIYCHTKSFHLKFLGYQPQQQMELQTRTWYYHPDSGSSTCSCDISCAWNNMQVMDNAELLNHFFLPLRPGTDISPTCIFSGKINGCPPPLLIPSFLREQLSHPKEAVTSTGHQ